MIRIQKILAAFIVGLVFLLPIYPVMAISPPDTSANIKLEFTSPNRESIQATVIINDKGSEHDPITLTKQDTSLTADDISELDNVKPPFGAKNFTIYQLTNPDEKCIRSTVGIPNPIVTYHPILLLAYTVSNESEYFNLGSFILINGKYTRIQLKAGKNCDIGNGQITDFIYTSIRHAKGDNGANSIGYALDPTDISANCNEISENWISAKSNMRLLLFPVDGKPNSKYWNITTDLDPEFNEDNITFGPIIKSFAAGLVSGGLGTLPTLYSTDILDVEVRKQYKLTKSGFSVFSSIGTNINNIRKSIKMLGSEDDTIATVCPSISLPTKFKWDDSIESDVYTSFKTFYDDLDVVYQDFLDLFLIASAPTSTAGEDASFCEGIGGGFLTQTFNQAFCAIIVFVKEGVDSMYKLALSWMNSSIGVDITQEELPDEPSTPINSDSTTVDSESSTTESEEED